MDLSPRRASKPGRVPARVLQGGISGLLVLSGVVTGFGWLYLLRQLRWFAVGPRLADALPLLQLPGFGRQPLLRVAVAWVLTGLVLGLALSAIGRVRRAFLTGVLGLLLLLAASQAASALTRNTAFGHDLFRRTPGLGAWLEAVLLMLAACVFPRRGLAIMRSAQRVETTTDGVPDGADVISRSP